MTHLTLINRNAILIAYKQPFIDWIRQADPDHNSDMDSYVQDECSIYLLQEFGNDNELWDILRDCYDDIFINEIFSWYTDESLWPKRRTFKMFKEWFDVKAHTMIYDLAG